MKKKYTHRNFIQLQRKMDKPGQYYNELHTCGPERHRLHVLSHMWMLVSNFKSVCLTWDCPVRGKEKKKERKKARIFPCIGLWLSRLGCLWYLPSLAYFGETGLGNPCILSRVVLEAGPPIAPSLAQTLELPSQDIKGAGGLNRGCGRICVIWK